MAVSTLASDTKFICQFFNAFQELQVDGAHLARIHEKCVILLLDADSNTVTHFGIMSDGENLF